MVSPVVILLAVYALMSVVSFCLYWIDKRRAGRREWRVPEATLHLSELLGGWPGAWIAQRTLRHKWQKRPYMIVFWMIVALHAAAWAWWLGVLG